MPAKFDILVLIGLETLETFHIHIRKAHAPRFKRYCSQCHVITCQYTVLVAFTAATGCLYVRVDSTTQSTMPNYTPSNHFRVR